MILFYSNYCTSCQMLMDQIERYGAKKHFKFVNVEKILNKGLKLPPNVTAVPSLIIMPQRQLLTGKTLFDYLLLPNKGLLFQLDKVKPDPATVSNTPQASTNDLEPSAFGFQSNTSSDLFSFIEEEQQPSADPHKQYNWASLEDDSTIITNEMIHGTSDESSLKSKKSIGDLSKIQADRALDLQNYLNTSPLPPTSINS